MNVNVSFDTLIVVRNKMLVHIKKINKKKYNKFSLFLLNYNFTYLQHFLQAVYFFFAWLSGMLFGFFIPEQLGLLWYFLLLRSTYTVVSPVCWLTLGVVSSITSSSILHPNVCTPPQKFPVFLRCSGLSGTFSLSPPPALPIDCLLPYRPTLRMRQALRCMYTFLL